ncbi:MAG: hypothetical protein R3B52_01535 [Candidatus Paceibacterota bacterium]
MLKLLVFKTTSDYFNNCKASSYADFYCKEVTETLPQKMAQLIEELAGGEVSKSRKKK